MSLDGPERPDSSGGSGVARAARERLATRERRAARTIRALLVAALLLLAVALAPSTSWRSALGRVARGLGFSEAYSSEATVTVSLGSPVAGAEAGRLVAVEATAFADRGIARLTVVADGATIASVVPSARPTAWHLRTAWDSVSSGEGTATVAVVAEDVLGGRAERVAEVLLDHTTPVLEFSRDPAEWALSPNGDGAGDELSVLVEASEPVVLSATVSDGAYRAQLASVSVPRRTVRLVWDGRLSTRPGASAASDGRYPLTLDVRDVAGNAYEATYTVAVDRVAPVATAPKLLTRDFWPAKRQRARLTVSAHDDGGAVVVGVAMANQAGHVVRRTRPAAVEGGQVTATWDGRYAGGRVVPPGEYETTVTVSDPAGNRLELPGGTVVVHDVRKPITIFAVRTTEPVVALTFDDLYIASRANSVLDILKRHGVKATFFAVGQAARANPALMRRVVAEGHALGNHSLSHPVMTRLSGPAQRSELRAAEALISRGSGHTTMPLFRPPYGATNAALARSAAQTGYPFIFMWDVDTMDWANPGVSSIVRSVERGAGPGSIVLMHAGPPQTPVALPAILKDLEAKGLRPVTLPELLWIAGYR